MGSVGHIANDPVDVLEALVVGPPYPELRVYTVCGRDYKYGTMSSLYPRDAAVRNACEYCFVEYDPEDQVEQRRQERAKRQELADAIKSGRKVPLDDLPF